MRRLALALGALCLATAFAPLGLTTPDAAWQPGRNDYSVAMSDGAAIDATMMVPAGTQPGDRLPAVVVIHGYGGSKAVGDARRAMEQGYVGFAYSTRGFGQSTGQMDVVGPRTLQDLKELVAWLKANGPVDPAKVGVVGASYGGGHAFQIMTHPDAGVATAVAIASWTDLGHALRPNDVFKLSYTTGFYATGNGLVQSGSQPVPLEVLGQRLGRRQLYDTYAPEIHLGYAALLTGVGDDAVNNFFRERSAIHRVGNVNIPVFLIQGMNDDLFAADQVLPFFDLLPTAEKRLHLGYIGHPRAVASGPEVAYLERQVFAWFDHYLKGVGPKPFDPAAPIEVARAPWDGTVLRLSRFPTGVEGARFALNADGTLGAPGAAGLGAIANTLAAGVPDDPVTPAAGLDLRRAPAGTPVDTLAFRTAPLAEARELLGTPRAELSLRTTAGASFQVAVKVYDVAPDGTAALVTRGIYGVPENLPGAAQRVAFDLQGYRHTFAAGHRVEVRVAASDFPAYMPERGPFTVVLDLGEGGSAVRLPFV